MRLRLPAEGFFANCAAHLLSQKNDDAPPPLIVPHYPAAAEVRRAMAALAKGARRLPRFLTLGRLAAAAHRFPHLRGTQLAACAVALPDDFAAAHHRAAREKIVLALLEFSRGGGDDGGDELASARADLFMELAAEGVIGKSAAPELDGDSFLPAAWRHLQKNRNLGDVLMARKQALRRLADGAPPVIIDDGELGAAELAAAGSEAQILHPEPADAVGRFLLSQCWDEKNAAPDAPPLAVADYFSSYSFLKTAEMEAAAAAGLAAACDYLNGANKKIAVVVFDRACARRLRALAERDNILLADETGWAAATLTAGAALKTLAAHLSAPIAARDFLSLLQSPGFFEDIPKEAAARDLAALISRRLSIADVAALQNHSREPLRNAALVWLAARRRMPQTPAALPEWMNALIAAADAVLGGWFACDDAAGRLRDSLFNQAAQVGDASVRLSAGEFNRRLADALERETISPSAAKSPLILTSLARAWGRRFDAAVLLGANARNLPRTPQSNALSDAERARLRLPPRSAKILRERRQLAFFLADHRRTTAVYHERGDGGEPIAPSPLLALLAGDCKRAFVSPPPPQTPQTSPHLSPPPPAAAAIAAGDLPEKIRVSDYATLMTCPYRFFAARVLGLEDDDAAPGFAAADYGMVVHKILAEFVGDYGDKMNAPRAVLEESLLAISRRHFADAGGGQDAQWHFWKWRARIPAYLDWEIARFRDGWRTQKRESPAKAAIGGGDGKKGVVVSGVIDRIDKRGDDAFLIDYKTGAPDAARAAAKDAREGGGEHPQLAMYSFLLGHSGGAALLGLGARSGEKIQYDAAPADPAYPGRLAARLADIVGQIANGAAMPANGADAACRHCDKKGLCRKDHRR